MLRVFKALYDQRTLLVKNLHGNALPTLTRILYGFTLTRKPIIASIAEALGFLYPVDYRALPPSEPLQG